MLLAIAPLESSGGRPFAIVVVDEQTGRGVPLVELKTVHGVRYFTDSEGIAAVFEPGLMGRSVFFHVGSHGYEFPKDGFGYRGTALVLTEGGSATLRIRRINVAQRLYRVTGAGVYRDSVLVGRAPPVREPLLNAQVLGQDSVLMAPYRGKFYWFWGDTNRPGYPLGTFHTPGATSELPGRGGLDPDVGVDLTYFVDETGFAKPTAKMPGDGPTWLGGLAAFRDETGQERLVAGYSKVRQNMETYEHGLVAFNPEKAAFEKVAKFPLKSAIRPSGHTNQHKERDTEYVLYTTPFPLTRVRARIADLGDVTRYEAFTCLEAGSRLDQPKFDRGPDGRLRYSWRANTPAVGPAEQSKLIRAGKIKEDEALLALRDIESGKSVLAHGGTVYWNAYRKRWIAVILEAFGGPSFLGEVWFSEADTPVGPWVYARKIVTHDKFSFYNPKHHPEFDKENGRVIFFEGTYSATFSGNPNPTPRYDYNQVMYKLDLADARLNLPVPVYRNGDTFRTGPDAAREGAPPAFFALERAGEGTVPVTSTNDGLHAGVSLEGGAHARLLFHAYAANSKHAPKAAVPLLELVREDGKARIYTTEPGLAPAGHRRSGRPVCLVWPAATRVQLPRIQ
jgi:hypothetical protein